MAACACMGPVGNCWCMKKCAEPFLTYERPKMTKIRPLRNNVIFKFLDDRISNQGAFIEQTRSGIIIPLTQRTQKVHRWGVVVAAGPEAEVVEGDFILIESLMWMEGVKVDDEMVWKTDDSKILAVTNNREACQSQAL